MNRKQLMKAGVIVDRNEYYNRYSLNKRNNSYCMVQGTPIIMNVEGQYISLTKLATIDKEHKELIERFIEEMKHPIGETRPYLCFRWIK